MSIVHARHPILTMRSGKKHVHLLTSKTKLNDEKLCSSL